MWSLKRNDTDELTKQTHTALEKEIKLARVGQGGWGGGRSGSLGQTCAHRDA